MRSRWIRWGMVLGFAMGGFFDGILLHQILQWHHLLSLVPGLADLRLQVLWDGYFHALMYLVAALGIWGLWHAQRKGEDGGGWPLAGALLVGFGAWHMVDGVVSHWVLGLHRIRLDSPNPLFWDLLWFVAFGLVPLAAGLVILKSGRGGGKPVARSRLAVFLVAGFAALAGGWAIRVPPDMPFTTVVFAPGTRPQAVMSALHATEARLVWSDPAMGVVVMDIPPERRWALYAHGALLVSGSGAPAGCFNWSRA